MLALATRNTEMYGNRTFDAAAILRMRPSLQPMAWPWHAVHEEAERRGVQLVTADQVDDPAGVGVIAYDWTPDAERLLAGGARPAALVSFEPPVIGWWLYANLPRLSTVFPHTFLFEGARTLARGTFHELRFPQHCPPSEVAPVPWPERRFLTMINSNKTLPRVTDPARWFDRPREVSLKRLVAGLRYRPILRDRYDQRLSLMAALADRPDFDLYGEGWQQRHAAVSPRLHARMTRAFRGSVDDKFSLLAQYRFALVLENTRFPGYVSEKLFDCFVAGCIPVYDGAPDVLRYVPSNAFVRLADFQTLSSLEDFLRGLPADQVDAYLQAGRHFLASDAFERFCAGTFARELLDAVA